MNTNEIINQIKDSIDIADLIGEQVKLRKSSRGFSGLCPFHSEDTPSFHVYTDTQTYYCFGCHESGNIFTYLMKTENISFSEALRILADKAGIKLEKKRSESTSPYDILNLAAKFFSDSLNTSSAALAYLSRRNLDNNDIRKYSLGYSPSSWDSLTNFLRKNGINDKAILDSGLALTNSYGLYDRFRGRLIFPIRDITGKIIAFGGRLIDGEGAKYINSPEGTLYSKRRNLYLMNDARKAIRERGRSILVEGYMDALRLNKCGFTETVASLGTSLTAEQAQMLSRCSDRCYICYDSDSAGQNAAIKGMYILAEHGLSVYVVDIPDGKDPDEFLTSNPPEKFEDALARAKPLILKHIDFLRESLQNETTRRKALTELFESLSRLNLDDVLQHMGSICEAAALSPEAVEHYLIKKEVPDAKPAAVSKPPEPQAKKPEDELEAGMCALLWRSRECRVSLTPAEAVRLFSSETALDTALAILMEHTEGLETFWLEAEDIEKISLLKRGEIFCGQMEGITDAERFTKIYSSLKLRGIERRIAEIQSMPPDKQDVKELAQLYSQKNLYSR